MPINVRVRPSVPVLLAMLTIAALALRLFRLDHQDLWLDEAASYLNVLAFRSGGLIGLAHLDQIAPLHTIVTALFVSSDHHDEILMRLPSVLFGALAVPAMYVTGVRLFGARRAALVAAALLAFSPFAVWYSQEARMYSGLLLTSILYVWACWPATARSLTAREWILANVITAAGLMMHHYTLFLMASFGFFLVVGNGPQQIIRRLLDRRTLLWVSSQILPFALLVWWLYLTSDQLGKFTYFTKDNPALWLPYALFSFVTGPTFGPSLAELRAGPLGAIRAHLFAIGIAGATAGILGLAGLCSRRAPLFARIWLVLWLLLPLVLAVAAALVANITFNVRYVIISFPALLFLLALGIDRALPDTGGKDEAAGKASSERLILWAATALLAGIFAAALGNHYFNERYAKERVKPLVAMLHALPPDTLLVLDNSRLEKPLAFYGIQMPPDAVEIDNRLWARTPEVAIRDMQAKLSRPGRGVWLVEYRSSETDPGHEAARWLSRHGRVASRIGWTGVTLTRFENERPG